MNRMYYCLVRLLLLGTVQLYGMDFETGSGFLKRKSAELTHRDFKFTDQTVEKTTYWHRKIGKLHSGDTELGTSYYLLSGQCSLTPQDSVVHSQIDDSDIRDELPASTVRTLLVTYALLDIIRLREIQKKEIPQAAQLGLEIHISTSNDIKAFVEDLGFTIDERTGHWPDILKNFNPRFKLCISDSHLLQNKCSQHLASLVKEQLQPQQEPRRSSRLKLLKDAQKKNT